MACGVRCMRCAIHLSSSLCGSRSRFGVAGVCGREGTREERGGEGEGREGGGEAGEGRGGGEEERERRREQGGSSFAANSNACAAPSSIRLAMRLALVARKFRWSVSPHRRHSLCCFSCQLHTVPPLNALARSAATQNTSAATRTPADKSLEDARSSTHGLILQRRPGTRPDGEAQLVPRTRLAKRQGKPSHSTSARPSE